jgi:hypothetical protein
MFWLQFAESTSNNLWVSTGRKVFIVYDIPKKNNLHLMSIFAS